MGKTRDTGYLRNLLSYDASGNITTTGTISASGGTVSYLPLSGGTLTGALTGTSAVFSGGIAAGGLLVTGYNQGTTGQNLEIGYLSASNLYAINAINRTSGLYDKPFYIDGQTLILNNGSTGRVGIGTASPVEPLSVSAAAHGLISQHRQSNGVGTGQNFYMKFNNANGSAVNYAGVYADIQSNTTGSHSGRMILQVASAGNLLSAITIASDGATSFVSSIAATTASFSGTLNLPNNALLSINSEPDTWGARFRTTTSTTNLGSSLKNIVYCGGGASEGFAVTGVGQAGTAFEVKNNGVAWIRDTLNVPFVNGEANSARTLVGRTRGSFTVGGSTSTFYPVAFQIGSGSTSNQGISVLQIERSGYDEPGYTSTGFGTFHCRIRAKADGWGFGASYFHLEQNAYTIPMLADIAQQNQTSQLIVWLRGGQRYNWLDIEGGWGINFDNASGGNYVTHSGNVTYGPTSTNYIGDVGKWYAGWSNVRFSGSIRSDSLNGSGNRAVYSDSNGVLTNSSSDVTLKTNVSNLNYGVNTIMKLRPVSYNWIPINLGTQTELGFIAQEVQPHIPEVIGVNNSGTLSLDYPKLTAVLVKAIQDQQGHIANLETRLAALENN